MKRLKKIIIYLSIFCFVTISIFSIYTPKVYAEVSTDQKAVSHSGAWSGYPFDLSLMGKYWTIEDATGIPRSTPTKVYFFYTDDNITFFPLDGLKLYTTVLNRGVGITATSGLIGLYFDYFLRALQTTDSTNNLHFQGSLYDSNNNFIGFCVNDITGCYYIDAPTNVKPTIPDDFVDNVQHSVDSYNETNNVAVDYFTFVCPTDNYITDHWEQVTEQYTQNAIDNYNIASAEYSNLLSFKIRANNAGVTTNYPNGSSNPSFLIYEPTQHVAVATTALDFTNFCYQNGLVNDNHELLFTEILDNISKMYVSGHKNFEYKFYSPNSNTLLEMTRANIGITSTPNVTTQQLGVNQSKDYFGVGLQEGNFYDVVKVPTGKNITIYKDYATYQSVNVTKDYYPSQFYSTIYNQYSDQEDNSITINIGSIDNSIENNETIYEAAQDSYDDSRDGSQINTPEVNVDVTVIIENTIPANGDIPDPEDPDPEDPEGEDGILDNILDALLRFFKAIGKILGTILAGLLEVIDSVLVAIADIADNFTGVTEFIAAVFSWLPTPVPQVIAAGLSITILAAIIRFIRG